tara:strand:+ start:637 stop:990 length:354 start_codon:yes stop_codon:yes gene_type:complete
MTENPYSPASDLGDAIVDRYRVPFAIAFWLTAIIAVLLAVATIYSAYMNFVVLRDAGGKIPTYVPLVTILMICCSVGFAYSASQWRNRKTRGALVTFLIATATVVGGPIILLILSMV